MKYILIFISILIIGCEREPDCFCQKAEVGSVHTYPGECTDEDIEDGYIDCNTIKSRYE